MINFLFEHPYQSISNFFALIGGINAFYALYRSLANMKIEVNESIVLRDTVVILNFTVSNPTNRNIQIIDASIKSNGYKFKNTTFDPIKYQETEIFTVENNFFNSYSWGKGTYSDQFNNLTEFKDVVIPSDLSKHFKIAFTILEKGTKPLTKIKLTLKSSNRMKTISLPIQNL